MFEDLDELARGVAENDISRRQAIRWAGYSVLGAALSTMGFADTAEALSRKARRRCRRKGGTPLEKGTCHCAWEADTCTPIEPDPDLFTCQNDPNCFCLKTTEGTGFCSQIARCPSETCSSSSECPPGWKCAVNTCCTATPSSFCVPPCGTEEIMSAGQDGTSGARGMTPVGARGT